VLGLGGVLAVKVETMPSGTNSKKTTTRANEQPPTDGAVPTVADATPVAVAPKRASEKRRERVRPERAKKRPVALPVLIVDETVLLPHMSIPFPIEDDEAAMVIERASRMPLRQVLVLTERLVNRPEGDGAIDSEFRELLADEEAPPVEDRRRPRGGSQHAENGDDPGGWVPDEEMPVEEYELCDVGVVAEVGQRISRPGGHSHVILQGVARGIVVDLIQQDPYVVARVNRHDDPVATTSEAEAAMTAVLEQVENYISMLPNVPEEVLTMVRSVEEPGWLADLIAFSPEFTPDQRQDLLEILDPVDVTVGDMVATVVPLRTQLAKGGLLVSFYDLDQVRRRDVDDRDLLRSFTDYAALTLDRGQAMSDREEIAVLSDRERIARDLHDVVIQRLFATGMQLQAAAMRAVKDDVRELVQRSVEDLDATIRDVRATIFELQTPPSGSLRSELRALVREYQRVLGFAPELRTKGPVETAATERMRESLL